MWLGWESVGGRFNAGITIFGWPFHGWDATTRVAVLRRG